MEKERIKIAIERVENMLSKHYAEAPKKFTEDLIILCNIAKEYMQKEMKDGNEGYYADFSESFIVGPFETEEAADRIAPKGARADVLKGLSEEDKDPKTARAIVSPDLYKSILFASVVQND